MPSWSMGSSLTAVSYGPVLNGVSSGVSGKDATGLRGVEGVEERSRAGMADGRIAGTDTDEDGVAGRDGFFSFGFGLAFAFGLVGDGRCAAKGVFYRMSFDAGVVERTHRWARFRIMPRTPVARARH